MIIGILQAVNSATFSIIPGSWLGPTRYLFGLAIETNALHSLGIEVPME
jgi:hypothetical protein